MYSSPTKVLQILGFAERLSFPLSHLLCGLIALSSHTPLLLPPRKGIPLLNVSKLEVWVEGFPLGAGTKRQEEEASMEQGCAYTHFLPGKPGS